LLACGEAFVVTVEVWLVLRLGGGGQDDFAGADRAKLPAPPLTTAITPGKWAGKPPLLKT